jgi:V/A-type H+-transporting ATPase subunit B
MLTLILGSNSNKRATRVRVLAGIMGEDSLPEVDRSCLAFGRAFEEQMIQQPDRRTLDESMAIGWELLRLLPAAELTRLKPEQVARHLAATHV